MDHVVNEIKLSFLGDITCDRPMLKAAKHSDGTFDFEPSLRALKTVLADSDYVVGNLETVCAGAKKGYNPGALTYNSPDELLHALKSAGISMVTTANNHCLDCGSAGLRRTIELLDELQIDHTGTYKTNAPIQERYLIREIAGIRVAFVSLTDCMNNRANGAVHPKKEWVLVNQLRSYRASSFGNILKDLLKYALPMEWIKELKASKNRKKGVKLVKARTDNESINSRDMPQIDWAIDLLKSARRESDFVVACVHCGGQFNAEPGTHSVQLYDMLEPYADVIIGNHPHVIQRIEFKDGKVRAYSLGSLNMSPSADYVSLEYAPDYSMLLNLYLKKDMDGKAGISRITSSILYAEEDDTAYVSVHPVDNDYYYRKIKGSPEEERMNFVVRRFYEKAFEGYLEEYTLYSAN